MSSQSTNLYSIETRDDISMVEVSEQSMDDSNICEQSQVEDDDTGAEEPVVN